LEVTVALETVTNYVALARTLLQDTVNSPYRYSDSDLLVALSVAMQEAKKLRPDLFLNTTLQTFTANDTTVVVMDEMYRMPLVYYMCGMAQLRDDENVQDQRAAAFFGLFSAKLLSVA
jgi:hypothetical protein